MKLFTLSILLLLSALFANAQFHVTLTPYYETQFVIIGDSSYYNRLDKMIEEKFNQEIEFVDIAYEYLNKGDYESTEYYARKVSSFEELYPDRYFLLTIASAHMKEKSKFKMYYKKLKIYSSPEELREANKILADIGMIKKR
jgi:hypothetical protein